MASGRVAGTVSVFTHASGWFVAAAAHIAGTSATGQVAPEVKTSSTTAAGAVAGTFEVSTAASGSIILVREVTTTAAGHVGLPRSVLTVGTGQVNEPEIVSTTATGTITETVYFPSRFRIWNGSAWV